MSVALAHSSKRKVSPGREVQAAFLRGGLLMTRGGAIPNDYTMCDYILNTGSASAAAVAIGTTSGINEPFEVDFQSTEIVVSDRPVAGYGSSNSSVSPVQGSMSYFYLRNSNNSFQHQVFRLNTSGDAIASTNGLLKNGRDLDRHTAKVTYTYNESTGHYLRNLYFDGVLTHSSTTVHPTPLIGTEFYVFGFSSSSSRFINGKIYGLRWWEEDEVTLKANLIPCSRNSDGAAGFWDTAQKQFFTSTYWTAHFDNE